jgi:hydroxymethylpyrimidine pyrophosphatase-like HAD family hydrolase
LHTTRYCAKLCSRPENVGWRCPLLVMDVDGVLDKQALGFPSTTWAGIEAVSLLHSHDIAVVLNTARSIPELKQYCEHYGFLGGVAEYGAFAWEAAGNQEKILVSQESLSELQVLAEELRKIPGVFLNEDYAFSIRAYTFEGGTTRALPTLLVQNLISHLKLNRLSFYQTYPDTAVVAKETDKGKGLLALLELAGQTGLPTLAIGDSEADLPMFAVAKSSFAPGHISCRSHAREIGCHIDAKPFQPGLLNIVRHIIHPEKVGCEHCRSAKPPASATQNLVVRVLQHADEGQMKLFLRAMCDPRVTSSFLTS